MALSGLFCADVLLRNYSLTLIQLGVISYMLDWLPQVNLINNMHLYLCTSVHLFTCPWNKFFGLCTIQWVTDHVLHDPLQGEGHKTFKLEIRNFFPSKSVRLTFMHIANFISHLCVALRERTAADWRRSWCWSKLVRWTWWPRCCG